MKQVLTITYSMIIHKSDIPSITPALAEA